MAKYSEYKIYDAHTHIFPDKIVDKATESIGAFYDIAPEAVGSAAHLQQLGEAYGLSGFLVSSTATVARQVPAINDFMHEACGRYPNLIGFGALHPDFPQPEAEIERIAALGLRGVKLHPDFQKFKIDDPGMDGIYKKIAETGLFMLIHTGDDRFDYSHPSRLARVLWRAPEIRVIAAHMGGWSVWPEVAGCLRDTTVVFDTSSSLRFIDRDFAVELIRQCGAERFMFGTDFPMWHIERELELFFALALTEEERRMILSENFERIFGLAAPGTLQAPGKNI